MFGRRRQVEREWKLANLVVVEDDVHVGVVEVEHSEWFHGSLLFRFTVDAA